MEEIIALTDIGNAERFIEQHKDGLKFCRQQKSWLCWTGKRWQVDRAGIVFEKAKETAKSIEYEISPDQDKELKDEIAAHCKRSQSWSRLKAMINLAQSVPEIHVDVSELDSDPMKLNCENGTYDLKTGDLLPHQKDDLITKSIGIEYNDKAECPLWLGFLDKIMAGKESLINYLQLIVGYCLTGSIKEQCLFIFNGFGANGKSTFLEIIRKMLGDYALHTPATTLLTNNMTIRNDLARLKSSRFVSAVEIGIGKKLNEALTKELTGGDPITSRFLFREYFEQTPTFKLFIAANYKPEIQGMDHGIWRRIRLIPFHVVLKDEEIDRDLPKKLEAELPGILAWAVRGCLEWQKNGLAMPDDVQSATAEYKEDSDIISKFIEDYCEQTSDVRVSIKNLYDNFKSWAEENADEIMAKKTFGHLLRLRGFKQGKSDGLRYWIGIAIKKPESRASDSTGSKASDSQAIH